MKHFKLFLTSVMLVIAMCSCEYDNGGFPKKVNLSNKMTEITISGTSTINFFSLSDYSHNQTEYAPSDFTSQTQPDSLIATLDWLTVKVKYYDNKITLIANRPPAPGEDSKMSFSSMDCNEPIDIDIHYK